MKNILIFLIYYLGLDIIKQDIARFISLRDNGIPTMAEDIFLSNGASNAIRVINKISYTII
jgi:aspartate/methionine/tyrosine aminotransferase